MINKDDQRKISSFKKFSEMGASEDPNAEPVQPYSDSDRIANPNTPPTATRLPKTSSTDYMMPQGLHTDPDAEGYTGPATKNQPKIDKTNEVKFYGKVAKLPKGTKASKGFNFLENIKVSKSSIWYLMVEKQDNELQMVKYNHKKGVDLVKFVTDLKSYYVSKYQNNPKTVRLIESIAIDGNDKYSWIKNIPLIEVDGVKMVTKITEDLIRLLSK